MIGHAFPVFLDVTGRTCLVVGNDAEAERKAALLREAGAAVRRSPDFRSELLSDAAVVIVSGAPLPVAEAVSREARERGVLVNVVDMPLLSDFIVPAIVDRAPVMVAISTGGAAPGLAKALRQALDAALPRRLGALALFARRFRPLVARALADPADRRSFWQEIFSGPVAALVLSGRPAAASFLQALRKAERSRPAERRAA
jgi:uroporphyrin-III C-methyltransferase / precorrin-2 dehydrogenase / sirohydrochlorin ferrochelatase